MGLSEFKNEQNRKNIYTTKNLNKYLVTKHSWHLVDPSPWPLVTALGAFTITFSLILFYSIYMWWRDIIREATLEEQHTFSVQRSLRLGMLLFIVSEIMFFFAFFWAFFHSSLSPTYNIGAIWPPEAIEIISSSGIPL